jgi:peptidoglycan/LPS O-acetylase OafA/YrhL
MRVLLFGAGWALWLLVVQFHVFHDPASFSALLAYPLVSLGALSMLLATLGASKGIFSKPILVYLGRISYGLYVYHSLSLRLVRPYLHLPELPHFFVNLALHAGAGLALCLAMASLSYRFFELPFLRLKKRFSYGPLDARESASGAPLRVASGSS